MEFKNLIDLLPTEMQNHILQFLSVEDLLAVRSVCQDWYDMVVSTRQTSRLKITIGEENFESVMEAMDEDEDFEYRYMRLKVLRMADVDMCRHVMQCFPNITAIEICHMEVAPELHALAGQLRELKIALPGPHGFMSFEKLLLRNFTKLKVLSIWMCNHDDRMNTIANELQASVTTMRLTSLELPFTVADEQHYISALGAHAPTLKHLSILFKWTSSDKLDMWKKMFRELRNLESFKFAGVCSREWLTAFVQTVPATAPVRRIHLEGCAFLNNRHLTAMCSRWRSTLTDVHVFQAFRLRDLTLTNLYQLRGYLMTISMNRCYGLTPPFYISGVFEADCDVMDTLDLTESATLHSSSFSACLHSITNLRRLKLNVRKDVLTDQVLHDICQQGRSLVELDISQCEDLTESGVCPESGCCLNQLKNLEVLRLHFAYDFTDDFFRALELPKLQVLTINGNILLGPTGVAHLVERCPAIRKLCISNCESVNDECVRLLLTSLQCLISLEVNKCPLITNRSLDYSAFSRVPTIIINVEEPRHEFPAAEPFLDLLEDDDDTTLTPEQVAEEAEESPEEVVPEEPMLTSEYIALNPIPPPLILDFEPVSEPDSDNLLDPELPEGATIEPNDHSPQNRDGHINMFTPLRHHFVDPDLQDKNLHEFDFTPPEPEAGGVDVAVQFDYAMIHGSGHNRFGNFAEPDVESSPPEVLLNSGLVDDVDGTTSDVEEPQSPSTTETDSLESGESVVNRDFEGIAEGGAEPEVASSEVDWMRPLTSEQVLSSEGVVHSECPANGGGGAAGGSGTDAGAGAGGTGGGSGTDAGAGEGGAANAGAGNAGDDTGAGGGSGVAGGDGGAGGSSGGDGGAGGHSGGSAGPGEASGGNAGADADENAASSAEENEGAGQTASASGETPETPVPAAAAQREASSNFLLEQFIIERDAYFGNRSPIYPPLPDVAETEAAQPTSSNAARGFQFRTSPMTRQTREWTVNSGSPAAPARANPADPPGEMFNRADVFHFGHLASSGAGGDASSYGRGFRFSEAGATRLAQIEALGLGTRLVANVRPGTAAAATRTHAADTLEGSGVRADVFWGTGAARRRRMGGNQAVVFSYDEDVDGEDEHEEEGATNGDNRD